MQKIRILATTIILVMLGVSLQLKARPSEAGVIFLNINPGARATGMGDAFVALADDATASYWNPAGLAFQEGQEVHLMHVNWLPGFNIDDMYYDFVAYKKNIEDLGTIGGNITYFYLGESDRTDESGNFEGTFKTYELAATLSYGTMLSENMSVGINTKFIYSHLADQGAGNEKGSGEGQSVAIDLGFLYKSDYDFDFGLNISNLGPKISYIDYEQADPLPTNLKMGLAYYAFEDEYSSLVLTADMNKLLVRKGIDSNDDGEMDSDELAESDPVYKAIFTSWDDEGLDDVVWGVGAEYWYDNMVALRLGNWNDDMGRIHAWTYGASLRYGNYIVDLSYLDAKGEGHPLDDTMRFSLNFLF